MRIYFLSSKLCALKIGGVYFGITDRFLRYADIEPRDNVFVEFIPNTGLPVCFFINENLCSAPPENTEIYILREGIAIYAKEFEPSDYLLNVISQEQYGKNTVTLFKQGYLQLSFMNNEGFFVVPLKDMKEKCKVTMDWGLCFVNDDVSLQIYTTSGKQIFNERILKWDIENGILKVDMPLYDVNNGIARCEYVLSNDSCSRIKFDFIWNKTKEVIDEKIIAYCFFESVLIGADYVNFLCDELKEKKNSIKAFLGEYLYVVMTDNPCTCGLVRKKSDRIFELSYFTVKIKNEKIIDIEG